MSDDEEVASDVPPGYLFGFGFGEGVAAVDWRGQIDGWDRRDKISLVERTFSPLRAVAQKQRQL